VRSVGVKTIYKLTTKAEWDAARAEGVFRGSAVDLRDGFIHFSTAAQTQETARKFFSGLPEVVLLAVDIEMLENLHTPELDGAPKDQPGDVSPLRWEAASDGQLFPHLYAHLPAAAITNATLLPHSDSGAPVVPLDLPS
jgi:uncharacterized protein (DUF952 family)